MGQTNSAVRKDCNRVTRLCRVRGGFRPWRKHTLQLWTAGSIATSPKLPKLKKETSLEVSFLNAKRASVSISRVLYWTIIYPGLALPRRLKRLRDETGSLMRPIASCTRWGLHHGQVAKPWVSSYLAFPALPRAIQPGAVYLCCTLLGVASTGR